VAMNVHRAPRSGRRCRGRCPLLIRWHHHTAAGEGSRLRATPLPLPWLLLLLAM